MRIFRAVDAEVENGTGGRRRLSALARVTARLFPVGRRPSRSSEVRRSASVRKKWGGPGIRCCVWCSDSGRDASPRLRDLQPLCDGINRRIHATGCHHSTHCVSRMQMACSTGVRDRWCRGRAVVDCPACFWWDWSQERSFILRRWADIQDPICQEGRDGPIHASCPS